MKNAWVILAALGITALFIGCVLFSYKPEYRNETIVLACSGAALWVLSIYVKKKSKAK